MAAAPEAFQYALLRVMPSLPRGEALNVGVVLHCRRCAFLGARTTVDAERLRVLDARLDLAALREHLDLVERVAAGASDAGPVAALERSERFGWLVAPSSTILQPSPVHTGLCVDPAAEIERLHGLLVASQRD